jgi:alpha-glucosidase
VLYSDAGDGYDDWRVDRFRLVWDGRGLELTREHEGGYAFPHASVELHLHGMSATRVWVDGVEAACSENRVVTGLFSRARFEA